MTVRVGQVYKAIHPENEPDDRVQVVGVLADGALSLQPVGGDNFSPAVSATESELLSMFTLDTDGEDAPIDPRGYWT